MNKNFVYKVKWAHTKPCISLQPNQRYLGTQIKSWLILIQKKINFSTSGIYATKQR